MNPLAQKIMARMAKDSFLTVIEEWTGYWMNQRQNSQQDYENYFRRAFGVDANMRHHLAVLIAKREEPIVRELLELVESQREALENVKCYHCDLPNEYHRDVEAALTHTDEVLKRLGDL